MTPVSLAASKKEGNALLTPRLGGVCKASLTAAQAQMLESFLDYKAWGMELREWWTSRSRGLK